jgi:hypothetical protein
MPPLPILAGVTRTALNYTFAPGGTATNVIHIFSALDPVSLADLIEDSVPTTGSAMWAPMSSSARLSSLDLLPLDGTTATYTRELDTLSQYYGQGGGPAMLAVAALVRVQTATRGRSNQGRIFIPFVGESVYDNGRILSSPVDDCTNGWNEFRDNLLAGDANVVVASYKHRDAHEATSFSCRVKAATQRRRQERLDA